MRICAFVHCSNSTYTLNKWKSTNCTTHKKLHEDCECVPPFSLHPFPTDEDEKKEWSKIVNRKDSRTGKNWQPNADSRICSIHFVDGKLTTENPYPSINITASTTTTTTLTVKRKKRKPPKVRVTQTTKKLRTDSLQGKTICGQIEEDHNYTATNIDCPLISCKGYIEKQQEIDSLKRQLQHAHNLIDNTKKSASPTATTDNPELDKFLQNDKKVLFYTGITNKETFEKLEEHLHRKANKIRYWKGTKKVISTARKKTSKKTKKSKRGPQRKLTIKQELLLTLMKVRHALPNELLSDLSITSQILITWFKFLSKELAPLIYWPDRESINAKLPTSVKTAYPNLRCTIDCTEISIERPRNLNLRALTWSDYKKNNTAKYLVGIAPNGMINFISMAWGGRASDQHITRESGFLNKLEPGDLILADCGFPLREDLLLRGATLHIPPASSGMEQMSRADIRSTKIIANSRIHVERAIGRMKYFAILLTVLQEHSGVHKVLSQYPQHLCHPLGKSWPYFQNLRSENNKHWVYLDIDLTLFFSVMVCQQDLYLMLD